ncbi:hypothetical protein Hypma_007808 [Hypsizygus marmoreus]|uniref:Uncharacterized protein n=1 Tax=Hypsizygus marmoreus TaxID=39966 RepID=A0A369JW86_HYPMA|nr:hypothetical protein Hypma_007808 [Hypsizygus marmoreus]
MSNAISEAKENWTRRKRPRLDAVNTTIISAELPLQPQSSSQVDSVMEIQQLVTGAVETPALQPLIQFPSSPEEILVSSPAPIIDHRWIAHRKPVRQIRLPKRYRDVLPEPASAALPPPPSHLDPEKEMHHNSARVFIPLETPPNIFGLSRKFTRASPPLHDLDEYLSLRDLCESDVFISRETQAPHHHPVQPSADEDARSLLYPYPNESSMLLGHWYWCDGVQKSQRSFQNLIKIVGDPSFRPEDVHAAPWTQINKILGDSAEDSAEWEDDDRWQTSSVTISVPFQWNWKNPGPKDYTIHGFHHRSLVAILREKILNPAQHERFHYEPFELYWQSPGLPQKIRVHGELYTSPEFVEAHQALQEGPGEPGCQLPRVVAALMFWSDATHLTSFGATNLWPLYMGFGNESKYKRCQPSSHLLNHVAYFQTVINFPSFSYF